MSQWLEPASFAAPSGWAEAGAFANYSHNHL
jgi:hypothetical protein